MTANGPEPNPNARTLGRQTGEWHALTLPPGGEEVDSAPSLTADAVPGYELLGEIGRGGMGVVYRARHLGLNRIVALKMVLAGSHARGSDLHRFRAEAEAVARLQHPNVVQVYDVGEANGLPYLSLELCVGSLAERLDGTPWPPKPAAELVETLARAVHAAHQAGILHRDIKPANVLLASGVASAPRDLLSEEKPRGANATPLASFIPKITDFGLAKRMDGSGAGPTVTGAILGTPSYMAPEQAGRSADDGRSGTVGPAIDVYALGAILYELLTGRPPFVAASPLDTLLQVTRDEPVPPVRLNPKTPRDVQTICLKCLEKDPSWRYSTAAALADDLRRYLKDEPITARPAAQWERAWKWAKRRPAQAGLIAVSVAAIVALLAGSWYFTGQLRIERDNATWAMNNAKLSEYAAIENGKLAGKHRERAEAEALNARRNNYVLAMGQAQLAWQQTAVGRLKNLLQAQNSKPGEQDLRGFEWHYWNHVARGAPRTLRVNDPNPILLSVAYSPDGKWLAALAGSGRVYLWDATSLASGRVLNSGNQLPSCLAFRPDGRHLAVGSNKSLTVFDVGTGGVAWASALNEWVNGLAYTPDGSRLVARAANHTYAFDAVNAHLLRMFAKPNGPPGLGVAISPDGRRAVVAGFPARAYDIESGEAVRDYIGGSVVAASPDGERLALVAEDSEAGATELRIVSTATGQLLARSRAHSGLSSVVAFSPDGNLVATAGHDNTARLWTASTGKEVRRFQGGSRANTSVAFSSDGRSLAVATQDGTVEIWPIDFDQETNTRKAHTAFGVRSLALDADAGRVLGTTALLFPDGTGLIDDSNVHKTVARLSGRFRGATCATFSTDGKRVAAGFNNGEVAVWNAETGKQLAAFGDLRHYVTAIALSADGGRIAASSRADLAADGSGRMRPPGQTDRVRVWDGNSGAPVVEFAGPDVEQANALALSADGKRLVTGSGKLVVRFWDLNDGRLIHALGNQRGANWSTAVALSPDGHWAAYAHDINAAPAGDVAIQVFDTANGQLKYRLEGHQSAAGKFAFSPDSRRLASAGNDDTVRIWDMATGQEVLSRPAPRRVVDLGFSRDGLRLSVVTGDGTLRTWGGE